MAVCYLLLILFVKSIFSESFYIALGEVFYDNRGFFLVQYSVEATFEQILIVEIELIAHGFAEIVVVHFPLYQRKYRVKALSFFEDILIEFPVFGCIPVLKRLSRKFFAH